MSRVNWTHVLSKVLSMALWLVCMNTHTHTKRTERHPYAASLSTFRRCHIQFLLRRKRVIPTHTHSHRVLALRLSFPGSSVSKLLWKLFSSVLLKGRREERVGELREIYSRSAALELGSVRLWAPGCRPWRLCSSGVGSAAKDTGMWPSPTWPPPSGAAWLSVPWYTNTDPISCE